MWDSIRESNELRDMFSLQLCPPKESTLFPGTFVKQGGYMVRLNAICQPLSANKCWLSCMPLMEIMCMVHVDVCRVVYYITNTDTRWDQQFPGNEADVLHKCGGREIL